VQHGLNHIEGMARGAYFDPDDGDAGTALLLDGKAMCKELRALDHGNRKKFWRAVRRWRHRFQTRLMPIKWEVHEKLIPQALKDRGVMALITKCSDLSDVDKAQALIVPLLDVDQFAGYDENDEVPVDWDDAVTMEHNQPGEPEKKMSVPFCDLILPFEDDSDDDYIDDGPPEDEEWKDEWYCI
jgi:hypothetical protein